MFPQCACTQHFDVIDGVVYQACADGKICLPGDGETIPFGTIADFSAEDTVWLAGILSYEQFEARMNVCCPRNDFPLAIRLPGRFDCMKVRAVRRQEKDGVGLAEAAKEEALFEFRDVRGDLFPRGGDRDAATFQLAENKS